MSEGHLKRNIVVKTVEMRDGEVRTAALRFWPRQLWLPQEFLRPGSGMKPELAPHKGSPGRLWKRGRNLDVIRFRTPSAGSSKGSLGA